MSGEYLVFDDPARRLPELDLLEGFVPGEPSLYQRVLIPVELPGNEARLTWAYIRQSEEGTYLPGGRWPETASG